MRKVDDGEKKKRKEKKKEKIITFIVATNVVATRPPERRPTGTPHAHANIFIYKRKLKVTSASFIKIHEYIG